jgi:CBS domain-containing protein
VWGEMTAGEVLAKKRSQRGIDDADALKEYMKERARMHTVKSTVSTEEAMKQLSKHGLSFLVVVSADWTPPARPQVLGIVSERQFMQAVSLTANNVEPNQPGPVPTVLAMPVGTVMTGLAAMYSVRTKTTASQCLSTMMKHGLRHLPVLEESSTLAGILSLRDLVAPLVPTDDDVPATLDGVHSLGKRGPPQARMEAA